jgi:hypothetical protein
VQEAAAKAVERFSEEELAAHGLEELTDRVVADKLPRPIRLDTANHVVTSDIVTVPAQQGLAYGGIIMPSSGRPAARGVELRPHIPYTGTRQAFTYRHRARGPNRLWPRSAIMR